MSGQDHERLSQGDPRAVVGITAMLGSLRAAIETERVKTGQERKIGHDDRSGQVSARVQRHPGPPVQVQGRQPTMQGFRVSRSRASEKVAPISLPPLHCGEVCAVVSPLRGLMFHPLRHSLGRQDSDL